MSTTAVEAMEMYALSILHIPCLFAFFVMLFQKHYIANIPGCGIEPIIISVIFLPLMPTGVWKHGKIIKQKQWVMKSD